MSVQQDWAEDESRFGSAPVPAPDSLTDPLDADPPRDPGPVTARATVPPVFDHPVRVVTARGAARPPVPAQARPAPISAPPAQDGAPVDSDAPVNGSAPVNGVEAAAEPQRAGRHSLRADEPTQRNALDPKTVVLPAFLTGKKEEPAHNEPARPQAGEKLPATERGMLVFVAALLALGTVGVVAMLGLGGLTTHHTPAPPHTGSPTPAAAAVVVPSPTDSPSPSPSPSPSLSPSKKPAPRPSPTLGALLGGVDLNWYCTSVTRSSSSRPSPPNKDSASWTCVDRNGTVKVSFTPDQVCIYQYRQVAHAVVGTLTNPGTWRCYK